MNTNKPVRTEKPLDEERFRTSMLDPFDEPRTIPSGWDVSELLSPALPPANNSKTSQIHANSSPGQGKAIANSGGVAKLDFHLLDCRFLDLFFYPMHRDLFSPF